MPTGAWRCGRSIRCRAATADGAATASTEVAECLLVEWAAAVLWSVEVLVLHEDTGTWGPVVRDRRD